MGIITSFTVLFTILFHYSSTLENSDYCSLTTDDWNNPSNTTSCYDKNFHNENMLLNETVNEEEYWSKSQLLITWIKQYGGKVKQMEPFNSENSASDRYKDRNYRGLKFKVDTLKDEIPIQIPYNLLMTEKVMLKSDLLQKIRESDSFFLDDDKQHYSMAVFLLEQAALGEKSFWKPYIDVLPKSYPNIPKFFVGNDRKFIEGTSIIEKSEQIVERTRTAYEKIVKFMPEFDKLYADFYKFSVFLNHCSSRIFYMPVRSEPTLIMIPLLDSLNHNEPQYTENWFDDSKAKLKYRFGIRSDRQEVHCGAKFTKNQEATITYGKSNNVGFYVAYGFLTFENETLDKYELQINDYEKYSYLWKEKVAKFPKLADKQNNLRQITQDLNKSTNDQAQEFGYIFGFQRFISIDNMADWTDFQKITKYYPNANNNKSPLYNLQNQLYYIGATNMLSAWNEKMAWSNLRRIIQQRLSKYPTTLENDERLLSQTNSGKKHELSHNNVLSLKVIVLEKRTQKKWQKICDDLIKYWNEVNYDGMKILANTSPYRHYEAYWSFIFGKNNWLVKEKA